MAHHHHSEHECCSHEHHHEHHDHKGCEHEHHHHEGGLNQQIIKIIVTAVLLVAAIVIEKRCDLPTWQMLLIYLVPYLLVGFETLKEAVEGLTHGEAFNEHFLMSIAILVPPSC